MIGLAKKQKAQKNNPCDWVSEQVEGTKNNPYDWVSKEEGTHMKKK